MTPKEKQLLNDMKVLSQDICDHLNQTKDNKRIPQIELEILSSNIKALYDKAVILKYLQANSGELIMPNTSDEDIVKEAFATPEQQVVEKKLIVEEDPIQVSATTNKITERKSINEQHVPKPSLNEKYVDNKRHTVIAKLNRTPIKDLKKAIGINSKYLLMNDLFKGENNLFNHAIDKLESFSNNTEALDYFNNTLRKEYNWDEKNKSVKNLLDLVERRYL